jgi:exonuclease III
MQYNAEWLFIDYFKNSNCPGSGCPWGNTTVAETHLQTVTNVVKSLNPDIINFCEVEGCDELSEVKAAFASNPDYYNMYLKNGTDSSTGQNVGILTKIDPTVSLYRNDNRATYPVTSSTCGYTGASSTYGVSKHYITEFQIGTMKAAMIGFHLLAFPDDVTRCSEREAQAEVLQQTISSYVSKGYEIIALGDANDFDAQTLDSNNDVPISNVLNILKGTFGPLAGSYSLTNVAAKIAQSERYSDWYDENSNCQSTSLEFSMIDHILVTSKLSSLITSAFIYHGYTEQCGTMNSDHYPVVVDFDTSSL